MADDQTAALIAKAKRDNEDGPRRGDHSTGCGCEPTTAYLLAKALEASEARVTTLHKSLQEAKCGVPTAHDDSSPGIAAPVAQQSAGACKIVPDTSADWGVSCAVHGEEYTRLVCAAPETKSLDADHPGPSAAQADLGAWHTRPDEGAGPSESVRHAARRESRDAGLDLDLDAIKEQVDAAQDMVRRLCLRRDDPEKREWIMSIPARPSHDPDLVIGAALNAIPALVAEVERLLAALANVDAVLNEAERRMARHDGARIVREIRAAFASQRSEEKR